MKKIEYKDRVFEVPETVWEMTLGQLLDLQDYVADTERNTMHIEALRMTSILTGLPMDGEDGLEEMHPLVYDELMAQIDLSTLVLPDLRPKEGERIITPDVMQFELDGEMYCFNPDFATNTMKKVAWCEDLMAGKQMERHLHYVLALMAWKSDGSEVFSLDTIDDKAMRMCSLKVADIYKSVFFFALQGKFYSRLQRVFLQAKVREVNGLISSIANGAGKK